MSNLFKRIWKIVVIFLLREVERKKKLNCGIYKQSKKLNKFLNTITEVDYQNRKFLRAELKIVLN